MPKQITRLQLNDRVYYRPSQEGCSTSSRMQLGLSATAVDVITWKDGHTETEVTLGFNNRPFTFQTQLTTYEARLLAQALLMAADDAEQATPAPLPSVDVVPA